MASYYNITIDHILLLNGVAEGLAFLGYVLPKGKVITLEPSFKGYQKVFQKKEEGQTSLEALNRFPTSEDKLFEIYRLP